MTGEASAVPGLDVVLQNVSPQQAQLRVQETASAAMDAAAAASDKLSRALGDAHLDERAADLASALGTVLSQSSAAARNVTATGVAQATALARAVDEAHLPERLAAASQQGTEAARVAGQSVAASATQAAGAVAAAVEAAHVRETAAAMAAQAAVSVASAADDVAARVADAHVAERTQAALALARDTAGAGATAGIHALEELHVEEKAAAARDATIQAVQVALQTVDDAHVPQQAAALLSSAARSANAAALQAAVAVDEAHLPERAALLAASLREASFSALDAAETAVENAHVPERAADAASRASAAIEQLHLSEAISMVMRQPEVQTAMRLLHDAVVDVMPPQAVDAARQMASSFDAAVGVSLPQPLTPSGVMAGLVTLTVSQAMLSNLDRQWKRQRAAKFARRVLRKDDEKIFRF